MKNALVREAAGAALLVVAALGLAVLLVIDAVTADWWEFGGCMACYVVAAGGTVLARWDPAARAMSAEQRAEQRAEQAEAKRREELDAIDPDAVIRER